MLYVHVQPSVSSRVVRPAGPGRHLRLYTMDDPRIFRPGLRRQYPYHKQLQWSKPYMCHLV